MEPQKIHFTDMKLQKHGMQEQEKASLETHSPNKLRAVVTSFLNDVVLPLRQLENRIESIWWVNHLVGTTATHENINKLTNAILIMLMVSHWLVWYVMTANVPTVFVFMQLHLHGKPQPA